MKISIVSTMYYSQDYLEEFCERCIKTASMITSEYEIILVNDGSPDGSLRNALSLQKKYTQIVIIDLSRNFGHHKAIMTGLQHAKGEYVFLIDCDLEEAPELLTEYWNAIQSPGIDVIFGIQSARKGGWFERTSGRLFYWLFLKIISVNYPANSLTARLMTSRYVKSVTKFKEKELDIWGVFVLAGYNQKAMEVTKSSKGSSTYTFRKKLRMAIEMITSLSHRPLYFTFFFSILFMIISGASILEIVYQKYMNHSSEGWASIMALIWFVSGIILFILGIFGVYLSKMFLEIKNRPLTQVKEVYPPESSNDKHIH